MVQLSQSKPEFDGPCQHGTPFWLSAHLYHEGDMHTFLLQAVQPFLENELGKVGIDSYFFIRYWEKGSHIRLRIPYYEIAQGKKIRSVLIRYFKDYFEDHPSQRGIDYDIKAYADWQNWYPNDSIQLKEYVPETSRYGGKFAIRISERQFFYSSRAVLNALPDLTSYDQLIGTAIQFHISLFHACGMGSAEAPLFFGRIYENWFFAAFKLNDKTQAMVKERAEAEMIFKREFQAQGSVITPFIKAFWQLLENPKNLEGTWIPSWLKGMKEVAQELEAAQKRSSWYPSNPATKPKDTKRKQQLWPVLESYVHMTNNRLGILNKDEPFIAYFIKESFLEL